MKYSIVMPVYNACKTIEKSIKSVLNQIYIDWELILIDDGSTDNTIEIVKKIIKDDKRVRIYHQENKGPGVARNTGISKAIGEYVVFIDSDDYFPENFLKDITLKIETNPDVIFLNMIREDEKGKIKKIINVKKFSKYNKEELLNFVITGKIPWGASSKVVKRDIIKNNGFLDLDVGEELIYSYNLIKNSNKIVFLEDVYYHYVDNIHGQHKKGGCDPWYDISIFTQKYMKDLELEEKHAKAINCLAVKSLIISMYRYSCNYSFFCAMENMKKNVKKYKEKFNLNNIDYFYLDKNSTIIYFLIKFKLYFTIFFLSKIKSKYY